MGLQLDHLLIPCIDREAAARRLASLFDVPWGPARFGPFTSVYVNEGLTLDFDQWPDEIPQGHYCFRVDQAGFDAVLERLRAEGIAFRSTPHGPDDFRVNTSLGSCIVYWSEPDGHVWELLTASYARAPDGANNATAGPA
jgi:catechol 2,3-dioxygenase-like lactoylglutathione lyase family enzyme